ncbi:MAG: DUF1844 domain-containing protein [Planctomycetota bacterium]|nr:DUF1844 domain-containing protein [Planctomycetota bacterium]MDA1179095.1 DUF1844 domain-containing protein [Planctomycetota bacterium]
MNERHEPGKIIVDSDWKEQVAQEKELHKSRGNSPPPAADTVANATDSVGEGPIPEASLLILVINIATQAMMSLGQIPDHLQGHVQVDLEVAKFHIDMLEILQEKTRGNLDAEELRYMESTLVQLRLAFVAASHGK